MKNARAAKSPDMTHRKMEFRMIFSAAKKVIIKYVIRKIVAVAISTPRMKESDWSSAFLADVLPLA